MSAALTLIVGAISLVGALNAHRPRRSLALMIPSWFAAFLVVELAVHLTLIGAVLIALLAVFGDALSSWAGIAGLALWAVAAILVVPFSLSSLRTRLDIQGRPDDFEAGTLDPTGPGLPWWLYVVPVLMWWRPGVKTERGHVYAEIGNLKLKLDVARPKVDPGKPLPAVINVHGGVWMFGSRYEQGVPLMNHLAANGFIAFNIDYRLSPRATMPDHIQDVKRAIAYVREHAGELGVDPDFIAITGGSAGGHLAALAALTADDKTLQPGFETSDTTIQAAVPFYGAYDLVDEHRKAEPALRHLVEKYVMKRNIEQEPDAFYAASPVHRVRRDAPPFFVIHGTGDTILPIAGSRRFVGDLRAVSDQPVLYAEMEGGQHAFDCLPTRRSAPIIRAVERYLTAIYATRHASAAVSEQVAEDVLTS